MCYFDGLIKLAISRIVTQTNKEKKIYDYKKNISFIEIKLKNGKKYKYHECCPTHQNLVARNITRKNFSRIRYPTIQDLPTNISELV